jgi:hypothetical protein
MVVQTCASHGCSVVARMPRYGPASSGANRGSIDGTGLAQASFTQTRKQTVSEPFQRAGAASRWRSRPQTP